jgi:taurine dioxygenase
MTVTPVTTAVGAEIRGVDLSGPLDDETLALIRQTYNERGVVFFRDQRLDSEQFLALGRSFGPLTMTPMANFVEGYADLQEVRKNEGDAAVNGDDWHSDQSHRQHPIMGTMYLARKVPDVGGDTSFVSMSAAFEALSEGLKQTLRGLRALHTNAYREQQIKRRAEMNSGKAPGEMIAPDEAIHPVVGRHPETGREVLFVNPTYTVCFDGWTKAESEPLLRLLFAHVTKPEFSCRFRWGVGSLAFWDNRQCLHRATNDYPGGTRAHNRLMVEGPFLNAANATGW